MKFADLKTSEEFEKSKILGSQLLKKYPGSFCLIFFTNNQKIPQKVQSYVVGSYQHPQPISTFTNYLKKELKRDERESFYLLINNKMVSPSESVGRLFENHKVEGEFLVVEF